MMFRTCAQASTRLVSTWGIFPGAKKASDSHVPIPFMAFID